MATCSEHARPHSARFNSGAEGQDVDGGDVGKRALARSGIWGGLLRCMSLGCTKKGDASSAALDDQDVGQGG